jgi:hypothetical protein
MNNKIAILVFGLYREFEYAVRFWDFKNNPDCDFYFSTWNKSYKDNILYDHKFEFDVTEDMIRKHIPDGIISINDELEYVSNKYINFNGDYTYGRPQEKMFFNWKNGLKLIKESGKKYNQLMLIRFDMIYEFRFPFEEIYNCNAKDKIYNHTGGITINDGKSYVNDVFFIGDFDVMSNIIETFHGTEIEGPHFDIANHILSLNLTVENIKDIHAHLLRPNVRFYKEEDLTLENMIQSFNEWMRLTDLKTKDLNENNT